LIVARAAAVEAGYGGLVLDPLQLKHLRLRRSTKRRWRRRGCWREDLTLRSLTIQNLADGLMFLGKELAIVLPPTLGGGATFEAHSFVGAA
jgi:hypothetical protein